MDKTLVNSTRNFHKDCCRNCKAVWLDGGELAEIQLAYESKEQTQQVRKMRERLQNMTTAEKAEYDARIAALVDLGEPFAAATREATIEFIAYYYSRGFQVLD